MSNINHVTNTTNTAAARKLNNDVSKVRPDQAESQKALGQDRLELSEHASFLARLKEIPDIRADKVANVYAKIQRGDYFTPEKLDVAVTRLIEDL
jgi:anti-sigma28 factor (negative regulator of flagellin synthesis)